MLLAHFSSASTHIYVCMYIYFNPKQQKQLDPQVSPPIFFLHAHRFLCFIFSILPSYVSLCFSLSPPHTLPTDDSKKRVIRRKKYLCYAYMHCIRTHHLENVYWDEKKEGALFSVFLCTALAYSITVFWTASFWFELFFSTLSTQPQLLLFLAH